MNEERPIDPSKLRKAFGDMQNALKNLVEVVGKVRSDMQELKDRVGGIETLIVQIGAEQGLELHQSFPDTKQPATPEVAAETLGGEILD